MTSVHVENHRNQSIVNDGLTLNQDGTSMVTLSPYDIEVQKELNNGNVINLVQDLDLLEEKKKFNFTTPKFNALRSRIRTSNTNVVTPSLQSQIPKIKEIYQSKDQAKYA
jgi:hypothetical protein